MKENEGQGAIKITNFYYLYPMTISKIAVCIGMLLCFACHSDEEHKPEFSFPDCSYLE